MKISYAICVCHEAKELDTLLGFITHVKDKTDEIVILVDRTNVTREVQNVLNAYDGKIILCGREFDNDFSEHKNYLNSKCSGDYIFNIDADEVPTELFVKSMRDIIKRENPDVLFIPRINICLGQTQAFLDKHNFKTNEIGWVNWPDFQGRLYKNKEGIKWISEVHEVIGGPACKVRKIFEANPNYALMHVKTVKRQNMQNELYDAISDKRFEGNQV